MIQMLHELTFYIILLPSRTNKFPLSFLIYFSECSAGSHLRMPTKSSIVIRNEKKIEFLYSSKKELKAVYKGSNLDKPIQITMSFLTPE